MNPRPSRPFTAKYHGECACCGEEIDGGETEIVMYDGEAYIASHAPEED